MWEAVEVPTPEVSGPATQFENVLRGLEAQMIKDPAEETLGVGAEAPAQVDVGVEVGGSFILVGEKVILVCVSVRTPRSKGIRRKGYGE